MRIICQALVLFSMLEARLCLASDNAHHAINWWGLGSAYKDTPALGWLTLTFALFIFILVKTTKKPLGLYLEARSNDIRKAIEEGEKARLAGEQQLKLYDEKLRGLDQEIAKLKQAFMDQAAAEKIEKERLANEAHERILRDVKDSIKANVERSKNRLAEEVIKKALAQAQKTILENQHDVVDERLKERFVTDLKASAKDLPL